MVKMRLTGKYAGSVIWIIILSLMIIGLAYAYNYWVVYHIEKDDSSSRCMCGLLDEDRVLQMFIEIKAEIYGVKPIYFALIGFPIGAILAFLSIFNVKIAKNIFRGSSIAVSTTYIPYLIYVEYSYGIYCILCTVMQATVILSTVLSIASIFIENRI